MFILSEEQFKKLLIAGGFDAILLSDQSNEISILGENCFKFYINFE